MLAVIQIFPKDFTIIKPITTKPQKRSDKNASIRCSLLRTFCSNHSNLNTIFHTSYETQTIHRNKAVNIHEKNHS